MSDEQSRPRAEQSARSLLARLLVLLAATWRRLAGAGGEVDVARSARSARSRLRSARQLARLVVDAWPVVVRGHLPDLADQVPISRERQPGHPAWCSQGSQCWPPSAGGGSEGDLIVEVVHCSVTRVEHKDGVAEVTVERFDTLHDDGRHDVEQVVYMNTDGTFDADQAEAFALSILRAVRQIDAGLDGTPGGIPVVLAALPEPWPPPGRNRAV